jgi:hypothetical protein
MLRLWPIQTIPSAIPRLDSVDGKYGHYCPHRRKRDGTFDSFCLTCLATIANAKTEGELVEHDQNYICEQSFLADRRSFETPAFDVNNLPCL